MLRSPAALLGLQPNLQAQALSPAVGWWFLLAAVALCSALILQSDRWRRWWLQREDPRSIGLFRIVFGTLLLCNVNNLWPYFEFLFTDEGIFTTDMARQIFAGHQLRGFGDGLGPGEPYGFFDVRAVLEFLEGPRFSLLYFWDGPTFFWIHLIAFELAAVLFVLGLWSRVTGLLAWLLMNSIFWRNQLFWEGTELVFRVFGAYLVLARSGHAYSLDNWLRCRRLRKQGRLSERDGPGGGAGLPPSKAHPHGLRAVYRLIPAWPRRLMILQLATIYLTTGALKNGPTWLEGDAFYYALNLDHFYRFPPQQLSYHLATNLFRVMTHVTHLWELGFPLVVVGLVVRWARYERLPPLSRPKASAVRACWIVFALATGAMVAMTWDVHFTPFSVQWFWVLWIGSIVTGSWVWWRLGTDPPRVLRSHTLDREWFCRWFLGRRIWLSLAVVFHAHLMVLMSVGWFQAGMLAVNIAFLSGWEVATLLRVSGRGAARLGLPGIPTDVRRGRAPLPSEDPTLVQKPRDPAKLPEWAAFSALGIVVAAILVCVFWNPPWGWHRLLLVAVTLLAAVTVQQWRADRHKSLPLIDADSGRLRRPWAYGPLGRFITGTLLVWHLIAVAAWLLPTKGSLHAFRIPARIFFAHWLELTQTDQTWGMFAPNPPMTNVMLETVVIDAEGDKHDLQTDVYAKSRRPLPMIAYDRIRKINRRILGEADGGIEYSKWFARWVCRDWQIRHDGELPAKVQLYELAYDIPPPDYIRQHGFYDPQKQLADAGRETLVHEVDCPTAPMGQMPPEILQRHEITVPDDYDFRPWEKHKLRAWERERSRE